MALPSLEVDHIVVTMDCHPLDQQGASRGAGRSLATTLYEIQRGSGNIWAPLFQGIESKSRGSKIHFIEKGRERDRE